MHAETYLTQAHPDKVGLEEQGDLDVANQVLKAWKTLSNPESRSVYDARLSGIWRYDLALHTVDRRCLSLFEQAMDHQ
jgi:hypothetical protein